MVRTSQIVLRSGMNASRIHQALSDQVLTSSLNHQVMARVLRFYTLRFSVMYTPSDAVENCSILKGVERGEF